MAEAAKKRAEAPPTEQDTLEAVEKFSSAMQVFQRKAEEERREKIAVAMAGEVVTPSEVLVRDPDTHERLVFYAVTPTQYLKIGFKLMRRSELKRVPENRRTQTCVDWPQQAKVQIVQSCLVEPDLAEFLSIKKPAAAVNWVDENLSWPTLDDFLICIYNESQPKMRMPEFRAEGSEGGAGDSRKE